MLPACEVCNGQGSSAEFGESFFGITCCLQLYVGAFGFIVNQEAGQYFACVQAHIHIIVMEVMQWKFVHFFKTWWNPVVNCFLVGSGLDLFSKLFIWIMRERTRPCKLVVTVQHGNWVSNLTLGGE